MKSLLTSSIVVSIGLLLGRLAGFARESTIAAAFGASIDADIVVLMLTVPDLLVNILVGGALGAALIPAFKQLADAESKALFVQSSLTVAVIFSLVALVLSIFSVPLVGIFAPGFDGESVVRSANSLSLVLAVIPFTVLAGVTTAYLHSQNRFAVASLGTLVFNSCVIVGLLLVVQGQGGLALVAIAVLVGGSIRWILQVAATGVFPLRLTWFQEWLISRALALRYLQAMLSGGLLLMVPVIARALASYGDSGSLAVLNFSLKLIEFPLAISVTFLSVVLFPLLAEKYANNQTEEYERVVRFGIFGVLMLGLATAIPMALFSRSFAGAAFGWGAMNEEALDTIALLVFWGVFSLPFQGLSSFFTVMFNSRLDTKTPFLINTPGVIAFVPMGIMGNHYFGLVGVIWAMFGCYVLITLAQVMLLERLHDLRIISRLVSPVVIKSVLVLVSICLAGWLGMGLDPSHIFEGLFMAGLLAAISLMGGLYMHQEFRIWVVGLRNRRGGA